MTPEDHARRLRDLNVTPQLNPIESTIMSLLRTHHREEDRIIDVPRLQDECQRNGLTPQEFSQGFVRLLIRRLLEPCGDFTYALAAEKDEPRAVMGSMKERQDMMPPATARSVQMEGARQ